MSPRLTDLFLNSQSDERLVGLARAGHERAFATIVVRYRRSLHGLARRLVSEGTAEDVVQQTFLSAYEALQSGAEVRHLSGWLHRILRNTAIRSGSRAPAAAELDAAALSGEPLEESVQRRQQAFDLFAELAALPARQREALLATALHGQSREAIAASTGVSEGAVRQLVHRARVTLRTAVTALTPWPLASWLASASDALSSDQLGEAAAGAGGVSLAGAGLKLGALMASAAVATGVAGVAGSPRPVHPVPAQHRPHVAAPVRGTGGARAGVASVGAVFVDQGERLRAVGQGEPRGRDESEDPGSGRGGDGGPAGEGSRDLDGGGSGSDGSRSGEGASGSSGRRDSGGGGGSGSSGGSGTGGASGTSDGGSGTSDGGSGTSSGDSGTSSSVATGSDSGGGPGPSIATASSGSSGAGSSQVQLSSIDGGGSDDH